jgi:hypothetical protein
VFPCLLDTDQHLTILTLVHYFPYPYLPLLVSHPLWPSTTCNKCTYKKNTLSFQVTVFLGCLTIMTKALIASEISGTTHQKHQGVLNFLQLCSSWISEHYLYLTLGTNMLSHQCMVIYNLPPFQNQSQGTTIRQEWHCCVSFHCTKRGKIIYKSQISEKCLLIYVYIKYIITYYIFKLIFYAHIEFWKVTISFTMSVYPHGMTWLPRNNFHEIWYLSIFLKSVEKIQISLKSDLNNRYFTWTAVYIFDYISLTSS